MGEVAVQKPGPVEVAFTLDNAGDGSTYRRIYTLFLTDDPKTIPDGTRKKLELLIGKYL